MHREFLVAALLVAAFAGDGRAGFSYEPAFSPAEQATIEANETLKTVVALDPWLVRDILDVLSRKSSSNAAPPKPTADPARSADPDLVAPEFSPQATMEWIELLRRARAIKDGRSGIGETERSAEGSVDLLGVLRSARDAKPASR